MSNIEECAIQCRQFRALLLNVPGIQALHLFAMAAPYDEEPEIPNRRPTNDELREAAIQILTHLPPGDDDG